MKNNGRHGAVVRIAGSGLAVPVLLALMLSSTGIGRAQAGAASPAFASAKSAETASRTPTPLAAKPPAKGQNEGIHVHGHWTIEVRNPDGKLVTHREFENGLASGDSGGAAFLAALLGRLATAGAWQVVLSDSSEFHNWIIITEANSTLSAACPTTVQQLGVQGFLGSCSSNLALIGPQLIKDSIAGGTLTLSGTGTVPQGFPASLGAVETVNYGCAPNASAQSCVNSTSPVFYLTLTQRILDGVGTDPAAVPVTAGQTVSVTVVISFTSGS